MKKPFFIMTIFWTVSPAAYAQSGGDQASELAECAAVYSLSASVIGNEKMSSEVPYEKRLAAAKSYSIAAGKALQASAALSDENTAHNKMNAYMQSYNNQLAQDKNMNSLLPKLQSCRVLVQNTSVN